jgi:hypothetical protein
MANRVPRRRPGIRLLAALFLQSASSPADCRDQTANGCFHLIVREAAESEYKSGPTCSRSVHRRDRPHRHASGRGRYDDLAVVELLRKPQQQVHPLVTRLNPSEPPRKQTW